MLNNQLPTTVPFDQHVSEPDVHFAVPPDGSSPEVIYTGNDRRAAIDSDIQRTMIDKLGLNLAGPTGSFAAARTTCGRLKASYSVQIQTFVHVKQVNVLSPIESGNRAK